VSDYVPLNDMTRQITYTKITPLEEETGISGHYHISALRYTKTQRWSWVTQIMICFFDGLGGTETTFIFGSTFSGNFILVSFARPHTSICLVSYLHRISGRYRVALSLSGFTQIISNFFLYRFQPPRLSKGPLFWSSLSIPSVQGRGGSPPLACHNVSFLRVSESMLKVDNLAITPCVPVSPPAENHCWARG
jgi:hypothetical protein